MRLVYFTPPFNGSNNRGAYFASGARTVICSSGNVSAFFPIEAGTICRQSKIETFGNNLANDLKVKDNLVFTFSFSPIFAILYTINLGSEKISLAYSPFHAAYYLKYLKLKGLNNSVNIINSTVLSCKSILYMIQNEAATSPITITLHADVYNKCMANADILAALETHTNISLASA